MIDARMVKLTLTGLPVPGFHVFSSISRGVNKQKLTIADQLRTVDSEYFKPLFTSTEAAVPQDPQLDKPALSTTDKKGEGHGSHSSSSHKYHLYEDHDNFPPLPPFIFDGRLLLLNIGKIRVFMIEETPCQAHLFSAFNRWHSPRKGMAHRKFSWGLYSTFLGA